MAERRDITPGGHEGHIISDSPRITDRGRERFDWGKVVDVAARAFGFVTGMTIGIVAGGYGMGILSAVALDLSPEMFFTSNPGLNLETSRPFLNTSFHLQPRSVMLMTMIMGATCGMIAGVSGVDYTIQKIIRR